MFLEIKLHPFDRADNDARLTYVPPRVERLGVSQATEGKSIAFPFETRDQTHTLGS